MNERENFGNLKETQVYIVSTAHLSLLSELDKPTYIFLDANINIFTAIAHTAIKKIIF
jgi:hypothetical protein